MNIKKIISGLLIIFISINPSIFAQDKFLSSNVKNTIAELSSENYRGRLAGDIGNDMAADYIKNKFKEYGLLPYGDKETFFQSFNIVVPHLEGEALLNVIDEKGNIIKKYKYGEDFKEYTYGASTNGEVKGLVEFYDSLTSSSQIKSKTPIIAAKKLPLGESTAVYDFDFDLKRAGIKAVIISRKVSDFRFRSPYKEQTAKNDGLIKIVVKEDVYTEIKKYMEGGNTIQVASPVQIKNSAVNNVIGGIKGTNPSLPPIVISAHFDHVGYDADKVIYPGALDNASGTGFLIECARILKQKLPERTIIFVAFNGEEEGLLGSKYFVEHPPIDLKDSECINFDMVGSKSNIPITILSTKSTEEFSQDVSKLLRSNSIENETLYEDNSDHASFCDKKINAVTFIHNDTNKIHTPKDNMDNISDEQIERAYSAFSSYLSWRNIDNKPVSARITYETKRNLAPIYIMILILISASSIYLYLKKKQKTV